MLRVWLASALVVGAAVAAILLFGRDSSGDAADQTAAARPPPDLAVAEVETYLEVMPAVTSKLGEFAREIIEKWDAERKYPRDPERDARAQGVIDELLSNHHLTRDSFNALRRRVEYAVDVVRFEADAERRNAELDARILEKEKLVGLAGDPEVKQRLEDDLESLRARRVSAGPPLSDNDRALVRRYWKALDAAAPRAR